jgi:hypothetical protein
LAPAVRHVAVDSSRIPHAAAITVSLFSTAAGARFPGGEPHATC